MVPWAGLVFGGGAGKPTCAGNGPAAARPSAVKATAIRRLVMAALSRLLVCGNDAEKRGGRKREKSKRGIEGILPVGGRGGATLRGAKDKKREGEGLAPTSARGR